MYGSGGSYNASKLSIDELLGRKKKDTSQSTEEDFYINDQNQLVHTIKGDETLEGLSIKYNVKVCLGI